MFDIARWAIEEAQRAGAQAARIDMTHVDNLNLQTEDELIESLQQNIGHGLRMELYVDGRYGSFSTNSFERNTLQQLIANGVSMTRLLAPDPDRTLPDPSRYYTSGSIDECMAAAKALGNYREALTARGLEPTELIQRIYPSIAGKDSRTISISSNLGGRVSSSFLIDSQGFEGCSYSASVGISTTVSLLDPKSDSRPSDGWMFYALDYDEIEPLIAQLGPLALTAAQQKIGAHPLPTGQYTIAVEPVCLMQILDPLINAMFGGCLYQHRTFLEGRMGQQIASPLMTLTEEPQRHGAFGATLFNSEGVRAEAYDLIRDGRLCTWIIGTYYAHKLKCQPTPNTTQVLCLAPGERSRQEIIGNESELLLITGFLGGNCNEVTGDFSYGIEGQLYRKGERVHGVSGMNLTGNFLDLWNHLAETSSDVEKIPDGYFPLTVFTDIKLSK